MQQAARDVSDAWEIEFLSATFTEQVFPRHTHDHYVIGITVAGIEGFERNGRSYRVPPGSIGLINPGDVHTGYAVGSSPWVYRGLYPTMRILSDVCGREVSFHNGVIADADLACKLIHVHRVLESGADRLSVSCLLADALHDLASKHGTPRMPNPGRSHPTKSVQAARDMLMDTGGADLSLRDLAESVQLSPFHLLRSFTRAYGLPPHLFRVQSRVYRAKELLRSSAITIADIALETGFTDQSHMTKWFKRFIGVTPMRYRRQSGSRATTSSAPAMQ